MCPAPTGNEFWKARATHGVKKIFETPAALWEAACEYFKWVEENPLKEHKVTQFQGEPIEMEVPKMRAMSVEGFCLFIGLNSRTYRNYQKLDSHKDFHPIIDDISNVMRTQKMEGASADLLNPNIIARDLGLKDRSDVSSEDGSMTPKTITRTIIKVNDES